MSKKDFNYDVIVNNILNEGKGKAGICELSPFISDIKTSWPNISAGEKFFTWVITFRNGAKVKLQMEKIQEPTIDDDKEQLRLQLKKICGELTKEQVEQDGCAE